MPTPNIRVPVVYNFLEFLRISDQPPGKTCALLQGRQLNQPVRRRRCKLPHLEHFVQEGDLGRGQVPLDVPHEPVLLQRRQRQRAEELLGGGEAREQSLKVVPVKQTGQAAPQLGLGCARWA